MRVYVGKFGAMFLPLGSMRCDGVTAAHEHKSELTALRQRWEPLAASSQWHLQAYLQPLRPRQPQLLQHPMSLSS